MSIDRSISTEIIGPGGRTFEDLPIKQLQANCFHLIGKACGRANLGRRRGYPDCEPGEGHTGACAPCIKIIE